MRLGRAASILLLTLAGACGACGGHEESAHEAGLARTPQTVPTPDTTPIKALETPAGLALKAAEPSAATPTPAPASEQK
jgi:hypothetical protein